MALLKGKLENEEIVNDRLLRDAMRTKFETVNRQAKWSIACGIFVILVMFLDFHPIMGYSLLFCIITSLYMAVCVFFTWYYHKDVRPDALNGDLLSVARTMKKLKDNYQLWLKVGVPPVIPWMAYFIYESLRVSNSDVSGIYIIICGIVGGVIGGVIGYRMHRKVVNTCDEIINSIEK